MPMSPLNLGALTALLLASVALAGESLLPEVAPETLPFMDNANEENVIALRIPPPGYEPATTEAEWEPIYQANLFRDLRRYKQQVDKAGGRPLSLRSLSRQLEALRREQPRRWKRCVLVVIRGGVIHHHMPRTNDKEILRRARVHLDALAEGAVRLQLQLPDTMYVFNVYDEPLCRTIGGCAVPFFSMHKRVNVSIDRSYDSDILLPHMGHSYDRLLYYPWHQKDPRALLRSTMQATMSPTCARVQLARLSAAQPGSALLDVGFSRNNKKDFKMPSSYKRPYIGITRHALYKFLLNADGHVSSSRLGHIMQTNSVILKQRSLWIEYYYRSLVPELHVLEYSPDDVLDLLRKYQDPALDGELRRLANASQHFCAKYLTMDGKVRYTVRALTEYTRLFGADMAAFVRSKGLKDFARQPITAVKGAGGAKAAGQKRRGDGGDGGGGGGSRNGRLLLALGDEDLERLMQRLRESGGDGGDGGGGDGAGGGEAAAAAAVGEEEE